MSGIIISIGLRAQFGHGGRSGLLLNVRYAPIATKFRTRSEKKLSE
jgi:hypothetical protein